jgi:putative lipoic acid-binding regulatory protein
MKEVCIHFVHGDDSQRLKERILRLFNESNKDNYHSVSIDGSAFDSNQHWQIIKAVDCVFFDLYSDRFKLYIDQYCNYNCLP